MAQNVSNTSELTREQVSTMLIQPLEAASVFLAAGPTIFDTDGSPLRLPVAPGSEADSLQWIGESELIPSAEYDFSEISLLPSTMRSIKTLTKFSNELARQSIVSLDSVLQQRIVADVAARFDQQFLSAEGDGVTTPRGIFALSASEDVDTTGDLSIATILEGLGVALANNVQTEGLTLFVRPENYMQLRAESDADGHSFIQPDATKGLVSPVLGTKVVVSNRIPAGRAALVDMKSLAVVRDVFPQVKLLDQTFGDYDQQAIRVVSRADLGILDSSGLVTFTIS